MVGIPRWLLACSAWTLLPTFPRMGSDLARSLYVSGSNSVVLFCLYHSVCLLAHRRGGVATLLGGLPGSHNVVLEDSTAAQLGQGFPLDRAAALAEAAGLDHNGCFALLVLDTDFPNLAPFHEGLRTPQVHVSTYGAPSGLCCVVAPDGVAWARVEGSTSSARYQAFLDGVPPGPTFSAVATGRRGL